MKTKILLFSSMFFCALASFAQQPVANLTIFSDSGDKFFLYLNGELQNNVAQTNLRVEDLPQTYYNAKIVFEDKITPEISKNYLAVADADGVMQDVTYKIKRDKNNGKMSLKFFSMVPVQQNYIPPSNVHVRHYGAALQLTTTAPAPIQTTTPAPVNTTQTTTTTTTVTGTRNNSGVNVNAGGININIIDPNVNLGTSQTTTTTTTTVTGANTNTNTNTVPAPIDNNNCRCFEMRAADFSSAIETIKKQSFDDTRLSTAKLIAENNCLNTNQIASICKEFGFESTKLEFAKFAYDHCSEKKNYFKINNIFSFSSSTDELNEFVRSRR